MVGWHENKDEGGIEKERIMNGKLVVLGVEF
jgi:hypothetical protein